MNATTLASCIAISRLVRTLLAPAIALAVLFACLTADAAEPVCKKTITTETRADGATVIRVHTVCEAK